MRMTGAASRIAKDRGRRDLGGREVSEGLHVGGLLLEGCVDTGARSESMGKT